MDIYEIRHALEEACQEIEKLRHENSFRKSPREIAVIEAAKELHQACYVNGWIGTKNFERVKIEIENVLLSVRPLMRGDKK